MSARDALELALRDYGFAAYEHGKTGENAAAVDAAADKLRKLFATPAANWRVNGEPDPHGRQYECERAALPYGDHTDDELANAVFLCDHRSSLDSIGYLMAAKDRVRWLSRALEAATAKATGEAA